MSRLLTNWAGNIAFSAETYKAPESVGDLQEVIRDASTARAIGQGHSFSDIADTNGVLISTRHLNTVEMSADGVRVGAGVAYGDLVRLLGSNGRTLANLASLPHVSVAGAVATATHGSGTMNPSLASAVRSLQIVTADGALLEVDRTDPRFLGATVGLGALGVISALTLETVEEFEIAQWVFENVPWDDAGRSLNELLSLGYSTSLFLTWIGTAVEQLWVKAAARAPLPDSIPGDPARKPRHPVPGGDPAQCTQQLGTPGPAGERLPHFRFDGVPSVGNELQSEWAVDRTCAGDVFQVLRDLGEEIASSLYISEIRAVAADRFWLSPFYGRDAVTFHFTWRQTKATLVAIERVEQALRPYRARPHWGKLSNLAGEELRGLYPCFDEFSQLRGELDPHGKFANSWSARLALT